MADNLTAEELLKMIKGAHEAYLVSELNSVEEFLKSEKGQEFASEYEKLQGQNKDSKGSEKDSDEKDNEVDNKNTDSSKNEGEGNGDQPQNEDKSNDDKGKTEEDSPEKTVGAKKINRLLEDLNDRRVNTGSLDAYSYNNRLEKGASLLEGFADGKIELEDDPQTREAMEGLINFYNKDDVKEFLDNKKDIYKQVDKAKEKLESLDETLMETWGLDNLQSNDVVEKNYGKIEQLFKKNEDVYSKVEEKVEELGNITVAADLTVKGMFGATADQDKDDSEIAQLKELARLETETYLATTTPADTEITKKEFDDEYSKRLNEHIFNIVMVDLATKSVFDDKTSDEKKAEKVKATIEKIAKGEEIKINQSSFVGYFASKNKELSLVATNLSKSGISSACDKVSKSQKNLDEKNTQKHGEAYTVAKNILKSGGMGAVYSAASLVPYGVSAVATVCFAKQARGIYKDYKTQKAEAAAQGKEYRFWKDYARNNKMKLAGAAMTLSTAVIGLLPAGGKVAVAARKLKMGAALGMAGGVAINQAIASVKKVRKQNQEIENWNKTHPNEKPQKKKSVFWAAVKPVAISATSFYAGMKGGQIAGGLFGHGLISDVEAVSTDENLNQTPEQDTQENGDNQHKLSEYMEKKFADKEFAERVDVEQGTQLTGEQAHVAARVAPGVLCEKLGITWEQYENFGNNPEARAEVLESILNEGKVDGINIDPTKLEAAKSYVDDVLDDKGHYTDSTDAKELEADAKEYDKTQAAKKEMAEMQGASRELMEETADQLRERVGQNIENFRADFNEMLRNDLKNEFDQKVARHNGSVDIEEKVVEAKVVEAKDGSTVTIIDDKGNNEDIDAVRIESENKTTQFNMKDGKVDSVTITNHETGEEEFFNNESHVIKEGDFVTEYKDIDGDGNFEIKETKFENGTTVRLGDLDGKEGVDHILVEKGNKVEITDENSTKVYENGKLKTEEFDTDNDGKVDKIVKHNGDGTKETLYDKNGDGKADTYVDKNGKEVYLDIRRPEVLGSENSPENQAARNAEAMEKEHGSRLGDQIRNLRNGVNINHKETPEQKVIGRDADRVVRQALEGKFGDKVR